MAIQTYDLTGIDQIDIYSDAFYTKGPCDYNSWRPVPLSDILDFETCWRNWKIINAEWPDDVQGADSSIDCNGNTVPGDYDETLAIGTYLNVEYSVYWIFDPPLKNVLPFDGSAVNYTDVDGETEGGHGEYFEGDYDSVSNIWKTLSTVSYRFKTYAVGGWKYDRSEYGGSSGYDVYRREVVPPFSSFSITLDTTPTPDVAGYIKAQGSTQTYELRVNDLTDSENYSDVDNTVRVAVPDGTGGVIVGCADLVDPAADFVSPVRIYTNNGVKAWRRRI